jgi:hypothetical protein
MRGDRSEFCKPESKLVPMIDGNSVLIEAGRQSEWVREVDSEECLMQALVVERPCLYETPRY